MERIEFLELENRALNRHKGELIEKVWALEAEVDQLQTELSKAVEYADYRIKYSQQLTNELAEAYSENERLRKALEFYADFNSYTRCADAIRTDFGRIAREALQNGEG